MRAISKSVSRINHYPDDRIEVLKTTLSEYHAVDKERILLTVGSTEVLSLMGQYAALEGGSVLMSESSFPTIGIFAYRCGGKIETVPIRSDQTIDLGAMKAAISSETKVIFICNPNNPTSTELERSDIIDFCQSVPSHIKICIDEAYIHYSQAGESGSLISEIETLDQVIIVRTFSKAYGLAGLRLGYAIGSVDFIGELSLRHTGFDFATGITSVEAALSALSDQAHLNMVVGQNRLGREILYKACEKWGVKIMPSSTNFCYLEDRMFISDVRKSLADHDDILITKWPSMQDHIRISIGKTEWMEELVKSMDKYVT